MTAGTATPELLVRELVPGDSERIDAFVNAHPDATPFHLTGWTGSVERGCRQRNRTLLAEDAEGGLAGILPLTEVRSPLFGRALVSSAFGVGGGPLAVLPSASTGLIERAEARAAELGCTSIELRGGPLPGPGWNIDDATYIGFARDLATDDEAELLAVPRKQRAEIRRALGLGLEVTTGSDKRERTDHYTVYAESVRNLGTPVFPKALFDAVLDAFGPAAEILTVRQDGRALASVLSLYWRGTVMPYWGGGTHDARSLRANDLMYYALMCHARATRACTRFDFGRSKVGSGAASFKRNWGFEGKPISYHAKSIDGSRPRDLNPMSAKYQLQIALWKKLPLALANRIGPAISRGLG